MLTRKEYHVPVKLRAALSALLVSSCIALAQTNDVNWSDMLDAAQQWAQDNLDEDMLGALRNGEQQKVREFLSGFLNYLKGDQVTDMARLRETAGVVLPILNAHEETQPYAAWLRTRQDYFDVADELRTATQRPKSESGQPMPPMAKPSYQAAQELWIGRVSRRPWPKGADQWVQKLKTVFHREGVPEALVWMAEVESGFDARAQSPAGAVGMFQLMPMTARQYGLSLWPWDQRRQPEPSARAAARYLRHLHTRFGDWRLAVAAYNSGPGTVQRLLQRQGANDLERIASHLPAETQMYVPKVEATILRREGKKLATLKTP
jgi:membrane-bound lytic murein transglycosylase D